MSPSTTITAIAPLGNVFFWSEFLNAINNRTLKIGIYANAEKEIIKIYLGSLTYTFNAKGGWKPMERFKMHETV